MQKKAGMDFTHPKEKDTENDDETADEKSRPAGSKKGEMVKS